MTMHADVIVIGAGAAGLMAAYRLSKKGRKVLVLEARNRIGGRILTVHQPFAQPVEAGAEFIHGKLRRTSRLLKKAGIRQVPANGEFWRYDSGRFFRQEDVLHHYDLLMEKLKKLKEDQSVGTFLDEHFSDATYETLRDSVQSYVEGYYAGDLYRASAKALQEEWENAPDEQFRVEGGYAQIMQWLYNESIRFGCTYHFSSAVHTVHWEKGRVSIVTRDQAFTGKRAVVAVPLGVLQSRDSESSLHFLPALPAKENALQQMGFGGTIKIMLEFREAFWKNYGALEQMSFLFTEQEIPTFWTQYPQTYALLVGWCAGSNATENRMESSASLFEKSIQSLAAVFKMSSQELKDQVQAWQVHNWAADPFTLGGYTYITVDTKNALEIMAQPEQDTLYFAGEAFHDSVEVGTVEAALQSGRKTAKAILSAPS